MAAESVGANRMWILWRHVTPRLNDLVMTTSVASQHAWLADSQPPKTIVRKEGSMARDVKGERVGAICAFLRATDHGSAHWEDQYHGTLDLALRPRPDKRYPTLVPLPLPTVAECSTSDVPVLATIADASSSGTTSGRTLKRGSAVPRLRQLPIEHPCLS
jgi:hypothetical protein